MESVSCFTIDDTRSCNFEGNFQSFTLFDNWNRPCEVSSTFTGIRCHYAVVTLVIVSTNQPIFDFELLRNNIAKNYVLQSGISIVGEENQDLMTTFATDLLCCLSKGEIPTVVNHTNCRCFSRISCANRSVSLSTEFSSSRCSNV